MSVDLWKLELKIAKSFNVCAVAGEDPSQIPVTDVIPVTIIDLLLTETTLEYVGVADPGTVYLTNPSIFTLFMKEKLLDSDTLIVLIPAEDLAVIEEYPTEVSVLGITSPTKTVDEVLT